MLERIKNNIKKTFHTAVEIEPVVEIPKYAFNRFRNQYRSEVVLRFLQEGFKKNVIGITAEDMYSGSLNFIFGQAKIKGDVALLSIHRLNPEFYKGLKDDELFEKRAIKEAIHEFCHSHFGLMHCKDPVCVMSFSNTIADVDRKSKNLCEMCKIQIGL